jgi:AcrR family transcriptional regulator
MSGSLVLYGTGVKNRGLGRQFMTSVSRKKQSGSVGSHESDVRERILDAAFTSFMKNGHAATSTLEIATRARVSKRELYALVGDKREMLTACISTRASRLKVPVELPPVRDRDTFAQVLTAFGSRLVQEISDPAVVAVFRLAIAEAVRAPDVARMLDSVGREASRAALRQIMTKAERSGLLDGDPVELAEQFSGLLWGTLMISLLLGVASRPSPSVIAARAAAATAAFLQLHPRRKTRGQTGVLSTQRTASVNKRLSRT